MEQVQYIVETRGLSKKYGGVQALRDVSLQFEPGLIHALVGENGAGKSTLIRILSGIEPPTSGEILFAGKRVEHFSPPEAIAMGISTVYQEPMQMKLMSVAENIYAGRYERNRFGLVDFKSLDRKIHALMDRIGIRLNPREPVGNLSVADRQMVQILKALSFDSRFIIFDEPTASLTTEECGILKKIILKLREDGITVVYISHRLEEVFELCDTVSILRDGCFVEKSPVDKIDKNWLINKMVGRDMNNLYPKREVPVTDEILRMKDVNSEHVKNISLTLRRGEILGLSGLVGAGRTELANTLFGIEKYTGSVLIDGKEVMIQSPADAIRYGIGMVPENRKEQGLVSLLSVRDNITLSNLKSRMTGCLLDHRKERKVTEDYVGKLRIKTPSLHQPVRNLSGGNQQKVVFAKWMAIHPQVIILDEPTQGVDVGAKVEIYNIICDLAEEGVGIILISSEMTELIAMCDRICIMREGQIRMELECKDFSERKLMQGAIEGE